MIKRIILQHTQGPHKGLYQIMGTVDQLKDNLQIEELPAFLPDIDFGTRRGPISLAAVEKRFILYREIINPDTVHEFHPQQE